MSLVSKSMLVSYQEEMRELFFQRTLICLWLAVVFFSLFSLLDYVYCREHFRLFLLYRLVFVVTMLIFINLLKLPVMKRCAPYFMYAAMMFGTLAISLMTIRLGGFFSGYYVGILLMIAGALSVLPLRVSHVIFTGLSMYILYVGTVLLGTVEMDRSHIVYVTNNSFFFLSIVGVTAIQSFDDFQTHLKALRAKGSIQHIRSKLASYTDGLEETVQQRLSELEETDLKYRYLYESMMDLVVLIDARGVIQQCNRHSIALIGKDPEMLVQENITDFIRHGKERFDWFEDLLQQLDSSSTVLGVQLNLTSGEGEVLEIELSASRVEIDDAIYFQLIIRDISSTKEMERMLLDSERLIGTSRQATIFGLARLAECRDADTGIHLSRIRSYTHILAEELSTFPDFKNLISETFIEEIGYSAVLHDIGKVGISDSILLKPGKLTKDEFEIMKQHTIFGSNVLAAAEYDQENISFLNIGREIARSHHERWDAGGYPDGLMGDDIPLAARIISVADVYDALTSSRVYKPPFSHEESKEMIVRESGKQFDPRVVNAFVRREHDFKEARMKLILQQQPDQAGRKDT
jgi:PAS domain S-box-containing protein